MFKGKNAKLREAARSGKVKDMENWLAKGADMNDRNKDGYTALSEACFHGNLEAAQYLVKVGAELESLSNGGDSCLHRAVTCPKNVDLVRWLLRTNSGTMVNYLNHKGYAPLHIAMFHHTTSGSTTNAMRLETMKCLVDEGKASVNQQSRNLGDTPLHIASRKGCLEAVKWLVEVGKADTESRNMAGVTPVNCASRQTVVEYFRSLQNTDELISNLMEAARQGNLPVVKQCISQAARVDFRNHIQWALWLAAKYGHLSLVKFLVQEAGVSPHLSHNSDQTPLHVACSFGNLEIVHYLAGTGTDLSCRDGDRDTPLHFASGAGHVDVVQYLVIEGGVDINTPGKDGWSPLHAACFGGQLQVLLWLMKAGANTEIRDDRRMRPIHIACWRNHVNLARALVQWGADIHAEDKIGKSPLYISTHQGSREVVEYLAPLVNAASQEETDDRPGNAASPVASPENPDFNAGTHNDGPVDFPFKPNTETPPARVFFQSNALADNSLKAKDDPCNEKCTNTQDELEKKAILDHADHVEFYLTFNRKLYGMLSACESLTTGMVSHGSVIDYLRDMSNAKMRRTAIGTLVSKAMAWSVSQTSKFVPLGEAAVSLLQLVASFPDDRARHLSVARAADAAVLLAASHESNLRIAVERLSRILVRARNHHVKVVGDEVMKHEPGGFRARFHVFLGNASNSFGKEEAYIAADAAIECLMAPDAYILQPSNGDDSPVTGWASMLLGLQSTDMLQQFPEIVAPLGSIQFSQADANVLPEHISFSSAQSKVVEGSSETTCNTNSSNGGFYTQEAVQNGVTREEIESIQSQMKYVTKKVGKLQTEQQSKVDGPLGLAYADFREEYKDNVFRNTVEIGELQQHSTTTSMEVAILQERLARQEAEKELLLVRLEQLEVRPGVKDAKSRATH